MKVFLTGINGQMGYYFTEYMLELGHEVHGIVRRHSVAYAQQQRIEKFKHDINVYYGDLTDQTSIEKILTKVKPDYIINLAAQSHVRISFDIPQYTFQVNALGVLNLLEAYKRICPWAKFSQNSSSEMFGLSVEDNGFQRETTVMNPVSPYGCSKVAAYNLVRHYRRAYNLHACNPIIFNTESIHRGENFVTQKVAKAVASIKLGLQDKLELGNIDSFRDWSHAWDSVRGIWKVVNHEVADDFIISSMETRSVREMCDMAFSHVGLDYKDYVTQNPKYMRPEELPFLCGDSTKARTILGWEPKYKFEDIIKEMVEYWMKELAK